jgi:cell shape-determining protein MreD
MTIKISEQEATQIFLLLLTIAYLIYSDKADILIAFSLGILVDHLFQLLDKNHN